MYNNKSEFEFQLIQGNGKGKEYNYLGDLIFEGEYKNGEREGIGKEFNNGVVIFEGKYKNGNREGDGKEFSKYGDLIFEGSYLKGQKKEGILKEYYNEKFLFEANYLKYSIDFWEKISIKVKNYSLEKDFCS